MIKPAVSAGAQATGRFSEAAHGEAVALIRRIQAAGGTAMIQPYLVSVDQVGETAVVCIDGEPAYALHKQPVLRPDEVAPTRDDGLGIAEAMYDPELVTAGQANEAEIALARSIVAEVTRRFDYVPLVARVDMIPDGDGAPVVTELEAIEPSLYFDQVEGATDRVAAAVVRRVTPA